MLGNSKKKLVKENSLLWGEEVAQSYHAAAADHMAVQWGHFIEPIIKRHPINYDSVIDFACGYGRNTDQLLNYTSNVSMVDVNPHNIEYCQRKYSGDERVRVVSCSGFDLKNIPNQSATLLYTFDSVVHFPPQIVKAYLPDFYRVVASGGYAFVHHSNYTAAGEGADFKDNPHWRNYMSDRMFAKLALSVGFEVVEQDICEWGGVPELDCISLLRKR